MHKSLNLSGIILNIIVNLLICLSSLFNFLLPDIFAIYSINFTLLYILNPIILLLSMASLTISVILLLASCRIYKNFKYKNLFTFILVGLDVLSIILYTIFLSFYGWNLIVLNGFIIFVMLTISSVFLIIGTMTSPQNNVAKNSAQDKILVQNQKTVNQQSLEEDFENKLNILSSMKNMNIISEEEFSAIKKKIVYDYLNNKTTK